MSKRLNVKYPLFWWILMKFEFYRQIFEKVSNINFHQNPSSGSRVVPCGQTDMAKLIVAFRNFAKAPNNCLSKRNLLHIFSLTIVLSDPSRMVKLLLSLGTSPSQIHLIGFSLGAQLASYVAKAIPGIGRLTGTDVLNISSCSGNTRRRHGL
jgi:hypothetical protein